MPRAVSALFISSAENPHPKHLPPSKREPTECLTSETYAIKSK